MNTHRIKELFERCGSNDKLRAKVFTEKMKTLLDESKLTYSDLSIRSLHEAVNTTTFPIIMGGLLEREFMAAFNDADKPSMELVTKFNSNKRDGRIPGAFSKSDIKDIAEGQPYPHTGAIDERYVTISSQKRGEILDITEETIMEDDTGLIMMQARDYGENLAADLDYIIMMTIQDQTGYKAWHPSGTETTLYSTTATDTAHFCSNQITNALEDHTDIQAAYVLLRKMLKYYGSKRYLNIVPKILLVPVALEMTAKRLISSKYVVGGANDEANPWQNLVKVVSSAHLDGVSALYWYLGDFKKQYVYKEIIPPQVLTRNDDKNEGAWERDVKYQFKFRYRGKCGARDFRAVVKSTGAV